MSNGSRRSRRVVRSVSMLGAGFCGWLLACGCIAGGVDGGRWRASLAVEKLIAAAGVDGSALATDAGGDVATAAGGVAEMVCNLQLGSGRVMSSAMMKCYRPLRSPAYKAYRDI